MTETFFVFGAKKKIKSDNIIYIGEKETHRTLESYLRITKKFHPYDFSKSHLNIRYFSDDDCFVSYIHDNPLQLRLQETLIPRDSLVITGKKLDLEDITLNKFQYEESDYDIFSGEEVNRKEINYFNYIRLNIKFLTSILYQMLDCGYLELKNVNKMEDWIITFQSPILDIFIRYHRLETSASDMTTTYEFLINPQFRQVICVMLMKVISNFLVNNDLVKDLRLRKFGSWENKDLWEYIRDKI